MNIVLSLVNRNLKVFLRNRTAVFFSFLSIIIIIGLYALFLGDVQIRNISNILEHSGITNIPEKEIGWLVNSWIMAGLISVNTVTVTLGTYGTIVDDVELKLNKDFLSSPIKRSHIVLGYIISSWILSIVLSIIGFITIELYIVSQGGEILSFSAITKTLFIIVLSVLSFSAILFYVITFIKTTNAYGTLSTIIGTLIGFLAGIYVPPGELPKFAQVIVSVFPVSYSASMLRQIFMAGPVGKVFNGAPSKSINDYNETWGVQLYINGHELSWTFMIVSLIGIGVVFYLLSIWRVYRNKLL